MRDGGGGGNRSLASAASLLGAMAGSDDLASRELARVDLLLDDAMDANGDAVRCAMDTPTEPYESGEATKSCVASPQAEIELAEAELVWSTPLPPTAPRPAPASAAVAAVTTMGATVGLATAPVAPSCVSAMF